MTRPEPPPRYDEIRIMCLFLWCPWGRAFEPGTTPNPEIRHWPIDHLYSAHTFEQVHQEIDRLDDRLERLRRQEDAVDLLAASGLPARRALMVRLAWSWPVDEREPEDP